MSARFAHNSKIDRMIYWLWAAAAAPAGLSCARLLTSRNQMLPFLTCTRQPPEIVSMGG